MLSYRREVDKGKLTALASFEKLTIWAWVLRWSKEADAQNVSFLKLANAVNLPLSTSRR